MGRGIQCIIQCVALVSVFFSGCMSATTPSYTTAKLVEEGMQLRSQVAELGPSDVFEVRVYGEKELTGLYRASPDGTIDFPLVGTITVAGMVPNAVASHIRLRLQEGYIRNPYVTVYVKEYNSKKVFVLGQVQKPGTFNFRERMNIVQAIALAGGFTPIAERNETLVTRIVDGKESGFPVPVEKISVGLAPNFLLAPGDIVFVPESLL